jgi:hypothetical protein
MSSLKVLRRTVRCYAGNWAERFTGATSAHVIRDVWIRIADVTASVTADRTGTYAP